MIHFSTVVRNPFAVEAINAAQVRAARIDALDVDRRRYRGPEGDWLLKQMPMEPAAAVAEELIRRVRAADTEWTLTTWRRLLKKADRELPIREPMPRGPRGRR